jgi:hypothetical protein
LFSFCNVHGRLLSTLDSPYCRLNAFPLTNGEKIKTLTLIHGLDAKYGDGVSAETRNKDGRTDILVRINRENILIAECKIWHGEDSLAKALDQLLERYVTWYDTRLSLLIFSRIGRFANVLKKIPQEIKQHQYFVREETIEIQKEGWFRFVACHPNDRDRELTLTILAFDIPS